MTYFNTEPVDVTARKRHRCTWCGERIEAGEVYKKWACIGDDGPMTTKMHQECKAAMDRYAAMETGEFEYDPHSFTRGCTCESGDSGHGTYSTCVVARRQAPLVTVGPFTPAQPAQTFTLRAEKYEAPANGQPAEKDGNGEKTV